MALCLATSLLGILRLDSFLTGLILLGSLLVYDVFWVRPDRSTLDPHTSLNSDG